ncbi:MAG: ATP-binding protein [Oligoflexus sp.]
MDHPMLENYKLTSKSRFQRAKYRVVFNKLIYIINECTQFLDEPCARYIKQKSADVKSEMAPLFQRSLHLSDDVDIRYSHYHLKSKFYDHAPMGFVIMNPAAGVLDYNNKIKDLWGIGEGSLRGVSFFSLLDARYGIKFKQVLKEVRSSREDRTFECFCRRLDGRSFFARFHISVADVAANESGIILLSVLDITKELTTERIIRSIAKQASTEKEAEYFGHLGRLLASIEETELVVISLRVPGERNKFQVHFIENGKNSGALYLDYEKWMVCRAMNQQLTSPLPPHVKQQLLISICSHRVMNLVHSLNSYIVSEENDEIMGHLTLFFKGKPKESELYQDLLNLVAHRITQETIRYSYLEKEQQIKSKLELMVAQRTRDLNEKALRLEREIEARKNIEKKLIQAKQRAELSNRAKSQFLANMSHEIRTPLNGILGITSILKKTASRKKRDEYVRIINQSGKVLLRIIDDILDLARLEAGQLQIIKAEFDLRQTLQDIYHSHQTEARKKNLKFFISFPFNQLSQIYGDEIRIRQVIDNLVSNAIKFTESGHVFVAVRMLKKKKSGQAQLKVAVIDTGPGLDYRQKSIIWRRFERLDHSTTRKTDGFGLGLAITNKLLKVMNGRIHLYSQLGEGSRFEVNIPVTLSENQISPTIPSLKVGVLVHDMELKALVPQVLGSLKIQLTCLEQFDENKFKNIQKLFVDLQAWSRLSAKQVRDIRQKIKQGQLQLFTFGEEAHHTVRVPSYGIHLDLDSFLKGVDEKLSQHSPVKEVQRFEMPMRYKGVRILLAEDNEINQRVSADMLKILGIEVEIAANGVQAVDKFKGASGFDLVLMDCFMPEMDGVEAMTTIKRDMDPDAIVIAVTANAIKGEREKYLELGFNDYLSKPFHFSDLQEILSKYLAGKQ